MSCLTIPIRCYAFYHDLFLRGLKRKKPLSNKLGSVQSSRYEAIFSKMMKCFWHDLDFMEQLGIIVRLDRINITVA